MRGKILRKYTEVMVRQWFSALVGGTAVIAFWTGFNAGVINTKVQVSEDADVLFKEYLLTADRRGIINHVKLDEVSAAAVNNDDISDALPSVVPEQK